MYWCPSCGKGYSTDIGFCPTCKVRLKEVKPKETSETCSYCGEKGHSIQECPKWKGKLATATQSPVTVEEMRRALDGMMKQLSLSWERKQLVPLPALASSLFESALYAAKVTMKDASERRVFIQDFAAALNRRNLLDSELVDAFSKQGYIYMEASSEHSSNPNGKKKFVVRYLDNIGVEHTEEIEDDIAFYQRVRREGLSVISIHKK